jgi:YbgC/YbaW family acyl-CoA thioester hydrolase
MAWSDEHRVQLQEVDAAGVVFFGTYFTIAHQAYERALLACGFDLAPLLAAGRHALPMVHAEADYQAPLRYGDTATVAVTCGRIGERSFTLDYAVSARGVAVARLRHVHACLDVAAQRSTALPADLVAALKKL